MITSFSGQTPDMGSWVHGTFMVGVGSDLTTFIDILSYSEQDELWGTNNLPGVEPNTKSVLSSVGADANSAMPVYASKRKCRSTMLGGNDVINPLPQFGIDDDIIPPHYQATSNPLDGGLGQVYSENYDDTQQILYLGFGLPMFTDLSSFWSYATDADLTGYMGTGAGSTLAKFGYMVGAAPITILKMCTMSFKWVQGFVDAVATVPINKYYSFGSNMTMYYRFVNTILVYLATNMKIMGADNVVNSTDGMGYSPTTDSSTTLNNQGTTTADPLMSGITDVFLKSGLDMAQIMLRKYFYENGISTPASQINTDDAGYKASALETPTGTAAGTAASPSGGAAPAVGNGTPAPAVATPGSTASTNPSATPSNTPGSTPSSSPTQKPWQRQWFSAFQAAYGGAIIDELMFIGFRIDKGGAASESFSNSVGESKISQDLNSKFAEARDNKTTAMGSEWGGDVLSGFVSSLADMGGAVWKGLTGSISMDPLAAAMTGSAHIDIPEVWQSSSYSRTGSFSLTCLSPYGDMESIFQSQYVPLACILAGALPRSTGMSSHTSPFVCQAYCRGIFSTPIGIIESVEVSRGDNQFGFTANRLPLKTTIHITIKDLYPTMAMNMGGDKGVLRQLLGQEDLFGEYMLTLSGMGLRDRLDPMRNALRKFAILRSTIWKNKLSPFSVGAMMGGGRLSISRTIARLATGGKVSVPTN